MKSLFLGILLSALLSVSAAFAEYRAFYIEAYDHILKKKWEERTGFSPDKYILTHGGGNRLSVFVKATWMCYGDTSKFQPACPMPKPIEAKFQKGDRVKIKLKKHITEGWIGVVDVAYYQAGVKSNVYGVKFGEKRQLYNRYFEFDLEKTAAASPPPSTQSPQAEASQPTAEAGPPPATQ